MRSLSLIACVQSNYGIGYKGDLIWKIPGDMAVFKTLTKGHTVVMGYNTWKSLGEKPLRDRRNIILSHHDIAQNGIDVCHSFEELDELLSTIDNKIYIIGGESLYNYYVDKANDVILTEVKERNKPADAYFPQLPEYKQIQLLASWNIGVKCTTFRYIIQ